MKKLLSTAALSVCLTLGAQAEAPKAETASSVTQTKQQSGTVINLAGKQRMLTQKMSKLSLLISLNVNKVENKKSLTKAYKLYEKTLKGFLNGDTSLGLPATKNRDIAVYIQKLQKEWSPFSKNIQSIIKSSKRDSKALGYVIKNNEKLISGYNEYLRDIKYSVDKKIIDMIKRSKIILDSELNIEKIINKSNMKNIIKNLNNNIKVIDYIKPAMIKNMLNIENEDYDKFIEKLVEQMLMFIEGVKDINELKKKDIYMIYKKKGSIDIGINYHPISVMSLIAKLMQKGIYLGIKNC